MKREEIIEKLRGILASAGDGTAPVSVTEESNLMTDVGLSSVSMLYMVIAIEEEFGIRFDNVGVGDFATLGDVVTYIGNKLG